MATVNINGQDYEVDEEVAEQFSKFIRRSKTKDETIANLKDQLNERYRQGCRDQELRMQGGSLSNKWIDNLPD